MKNIVKGFLWPDSCCRFCGTVLTKEFSICTKCAHSEVKKREDILDF